MAATRVHYRQGPCILPSPSRLCRLHPWHPSTPVPLGNAQAALDLLEGHVCEAATFRYTASILLRLLPVRSAGAGFVGMSCQSHFRARVLSVVDCSAARPGQAPACA